MSNAEMLEGIGMQFSLRHILLLSIIVLCLLFSLGPSGSVSSRSGGIQSSDREGIENSAISSTGTVCVIAQTYHGHGRSLRRFIHNFQGFTYPNWKLRILNTDSTPFPSLMSEIEKASDPRVSLCGPKVQPHNFSYDTMYYRVDQSIASCCDVSDNWLLVTNADNYYVQTVFDHLDKNYEVISFGFWTRYKAILYPKLGCAPGLLHFGTQDLGSMIFSLKKWRKLRMRFTMEKPKRVRHSELDGCIASLVSWHVPTLKRCYGQGIFSKLAPLKYKAWKRHHVMECLLSHNPNPWFASNVKYVERMITNHRAEKFKPQEKNKLIKKQDTQNNV